MIDNHEGIVRNVAESRRGWGVLALLATAAFLAQLGGETLRSLARYERTGLESGELWRLVTGHIVHLGWGHLWPNLLALGLIGGLFNDVLKVRDWLLVAAGSVAAIDAGLYLFDPALSWYVGLSGLLHGFVAAGTLALLAARQPFGALLGAGLLGKLVFEQLSGPLPFTAAASGGTVIVAAHLYGAVGGGAAFLSVYFGCRRGSWL